jgi:glyoxylase-like metal-dependent hydrolase (beta-lactamase superfamily II)
MVDRPASDEIEVSLFGRGYGEAALLHLGDNRWVLIDSLVEADAQLPTLRYLEEIGVEPAAAIELIVATHWHDDHVKGISRAYAAAPSAVFAMPQAMMDAEVGAFLGQASGGGSQRFSSGVAELGKVARLRNEEKRAPCSGC